jgi:hypothetical protein
MIAGAALTAVPAAAAADGHDGRARSDHVHRTGHRRSRAEADVLPALSITTTQLPGGIEDLSYSTTLSATGGTPPYRWSVSSGKLPSGLALDGTSGVIFGYPRVVGTSDFTLRVTDSSTPSTESASAPVSITVTAVNPLSITTTSLPEGIAGQAYSTTLVADGGTPPYRWSVSSGSLPRGLSVHAGTGVLSGIPPSAGVSSFTIHVTDSTTPEPLRAGAPVSITILPALAITTTSLPGGSVGQAYSAALSAIGGTPPYAWSVSSGSLPSGLTLGATTGVISGSPTSAARASFTVQITDSATPEPKSASASLLLLVQGDLAITTSALPAGTVRQAYLTTLSAVDGDPPYTWSVSSGALPPGLALATGTGVISGYPTSSGRFRFTVRATDSTTPTAKSARASLSITVTNPFPLAVTTTSLPAGTVGQPYSTTLAAVDGIPPYAWTVSGGDLPPGLSLGDVTGTIAGRPTSAGRFDLTVRVTDSSTPTTQHASASLSITVANQFPLAITTTSLPAGTVGQPYSTTLAATGGSPPYTWSVVVGGLPAGLRLRPTGVLSGRPKYLETSTFTVQVTDHTRNGRRSAPDVATARFVLTVS